MAKPIQDKNGTYKIRKVVPAHLRYITKTSEYKRSLKTKSANEAKLKTPAVLAELDAIIENARMQHDSESKMSNGVMQALIFNWQAKKATELKAGSANPYLHSINGSIEINSDEIALPLEAIDSVFNHCESKVDGCNQKKQNYCNTSGQCRNALKCKAGNGAIVIDEAIELLDKAFGNELEAELLTNELILANDNLKYRKLLVEFAKSYLKICDAALLKRSVDLRLEHLGEGNAITEIGEVEHTVESLFIEFSSTKERLNPDKADALIKDYSTAINKLTKHYPNRLITDFTKRNLAVFRAVLEQLPSTQKKTIKSLPLSKQIELADKENLPRLSIATVKNQMMGISALFTFAKEKGLIEVNPVEGTTKSLVRNVGSTSSTQKEYTREEVITIFSSKLFTQQYGPKKADYGLAQYWIPLFLYYTGARAEEIAQLYIVDIFIDDEYPHIKLTDEGDDQSIKTGISRLVPIHPHLLELGLAEYIFSLNGQTRLFPVLNLNSEGKYNVQVSKWFGKYLKQELGIDRKGIKPFHSFRHHFIANLRQANVRLDIQNHITGHSQRLAGTGAAYGGFSLEQMSGIINQLPRCT